MPVKRFGVLAVVLALSGCGATEAGAPSPASTPTSTPTPTALSIAGTIEVPGYQQLYNPRKKGDPCAAAEGYGDISSAAQVLVSDQTGTKIAVGGVSSGITPDADGFRCRFGFAVSEVPADRTLYSVHVGNAARGDLTYSRADVVKPLILTIN